MDEWNPACVEADHEHNATTDIPALLHIANTDSPGLPLATSILPFPPPHEHCIMQLQHQLLFACLLCKCDSVVPSAPLLPYVPLHQRSQGPFQQAMLRSRWALLLKHLHSMNPHRGSPNLRSSCTGSSVYSCLLVLLVWDLVRDCLRLFDGHKSLCTFDLLSNLFPAISLAIV